MAGATTSHSFDLFAARPSASSATSTKHGYVLTMQMTWSESAFASQGKLQDVALHPSSPLMCFAMESC